jgi:hypothetical protein
LFVCNRADFRAGPQGIGERTPLGGTFSVSLTINQKVAQFFLDDGADVSCISDQEARHLGMEIHETSGSMGSMTRNASFRMAVAQNVTIGAMHFKDVSFAFFPDNQEPWSLVPMEQRGIIGLPLMIATGTFHWKADGTLTFGEESKPLNAAQANLFLDVGKRPVLKAYLPDRRARRKSSSRARPHPAK